MEPADMESAGSPPLKRLVLAGKTKPASISEVEDVLGEINPHCATLPPGDQKILVGRLAALDRAGSPFSTMCGRYGARRIQVKSSQDPNKPAPHKAEGQARELDSAEK